jgi:phosphate starvation-inducible PhoH-like protein
MTKGGSRRARGKGEDTDMKGANNTPVTRKLKTDIAAAKCRKPIQALNQKQQDYINALVDPNAATLVAMGVLGSSKTWLPSAMAADLLMDGKLQRVVVARPAEGKAKSVGFTKGDFDQKLAGWCAPILDTMKERMGLGNFEAALEYGKIILLPLEQVKGRSWDDTWLIADEIEDIEVETAKSLVTRMGQRSKIILAGDSAQQDLKKYSGLQYLLDVTKTLNLPISVINFDSWEYCVRSDEAKMWGMAFEQYDKLTKGEHK